MGLPLHGAILRRVISMLPQPMACSLLGRGQTGDQLPPGSPLTWRLAMHDAPSLALEAAQARASQRSNVLLFVPRPPRQAIPRGQGAAERVDLTVARVISELEDLRRRTGGRGPRWRQAIAAVQLFAATLGAVADLTWPSLVAEALTVTELEDETTVPDW